MVTEALHGPGPPLALPGLTLSPPEGRNATLDDSPSGGVTLAEPLTEDPLPSMIEPPPEQETPASAGAADTTTMAAAASKVATVAARTALAVRREPRSVECNRRLTWSEHPSIWVSGY